MHRNTCTCKCDLEFKPVLCILFRFVFAFFWKTIIKHARVHSSDASIFSFGGSYYLPTYLGHITKFILIIFIFLIFRPHSELDRERLDNYTFDVYATDSGVYGPRDSHVTVHVTLDDVNDNRPVFEQIPYMKSIAQNTPQGSSVLTVCGPDYFFL